MRFSIITVVKNGFPGIINTIKSILKQNFKDYEIIILDSCSSDGTTQAIKNFKSNKKIKFSTWLGNQMRYYCLNLINKNHSAISMDDENIKYILEKNQIAIPENFDKEKIELILDILNQMKDKRMSKIFKLRYFNKSNKVLSWNAIGKRLKISTQTAINIHNKALKLINTKLNVSKFF